MYVLRCFFICLSNIDISIKMCFFVFFYMLDKVEMIIIFIVLNRICFNKKLMDFVMLNIWFLLGYNSLFKFGCFVVDENLIDNMVVVK